MKIGLYIGRFQPFHLGHLDAVRQALNKVDFLMIGMGSSQESRTGKNPFTAEERIRIIRSALHENGIRRKQFKIIEIPDIGSNPDWPPYVEKKAGHFDIIFTGSKVVRDLFKKYSRKPVFKLKKNLPINATKVRRALQKKENLKELLSPGTIAYLREHPAFQAPPTNRP